MRKLMAAVFAALMMVTAQAASAATTFNFSFSGPVSGGTLSGSGLFVGNGVADAATPSLTNYTITGASGTIQLPNATLADILGVVSNSGATDLIVGDGTDFLLIDVLLSTTFGNFALQLNPAQPGLYVVGFDDLATGTAALFVSEVPEPATWATMLLGFAIVGAAMRRRRVAVAFAA